ncbi:MAG: MOSC N-terminal beta barrel domain-containing protein [Verrucomicrobia bacterium]|nr:MOSC N-terminal beta barrel domain-containing protein [Verrucomicrobiota bacterium]
MIVSELYLYPVKSCRGIRVGEAQVTRYGFRYDREFLVVDADGVFLTQRTTPALALVTTELVDGGLRLQAPKLPPMEISWRTDQLSRPVDVKIWRDAVSAWDVGDDIAEWFSEHLSRPCRVVRMGAEFHRHVASDRVPEMHRDALPGPLVSFADAFPFLIASEASLEDLNARLERPIPINRFRPNIVVRDCDAPYAEDDWQLIRIGTVTFRHGSPCVRCVVTTTDQQTLERGPEPLRTLATYRRVPSGGVIFAMNFFSDQEHGVVRVGMPVEVLLSQAGTKPRSRK